MVESFSLPFLVHKIKPICSVGTDTEGVLELGNPSSPIDKFESQFQPAGSSVEAFASTVTPVAVNHEAHNDKKEEAQHGEEHSEEDSNVAHSLLVVIACERKKKKFCLQNYEPGNLKNKCRASFFSGVFIKR